MYLINEIKNVLRRFRYIYFKSKFKSTNILNDIKYESCVDLRNKGIFIKRNFHLESKVSANLLEYYYKNISEEKVKSIITSNLEKDIKYNQSLTKNTKRDYKVLITDLFKKQDLINFANQDFLLKNIEQYIGFKPHLRNLNVQLDFYNPSMISPGSTQYFHRDYDDIKLVKVFFYLTNVTNLDCGPFEFIEKSHLKPWHLKYSDHIKNNMFLEASPNKNSCLGESGTLIMADTNGYHRGHNLKNNYRILVYAMYTSNKPFTGKLKNFLNDQEH